MMSFSALKTALGTVKVGLHDFRDSHWCAENHHRCAGSAFYFFILLPFCFKKLPFYFLTFYFINGRLFALLLTL